MAAGVQLTAARGRLAAKLQTGARCVRHKVCCKPSDLHRLQTCSQICRHQTAYLGNISISVSTTVCSCSKGAALCVLQVPEAKGHAFALLNAFVDVCEAIEDGDPSGLDLSDLAAAGVPAALPLPRADAAYASERDIEAVKQWVLSAAMQVCAFGSLLQPLCLFMHQQRQRRPTLLRTQPPVLVAKLRQSMHGTPARCTHLLAECCEHTRTPFPWCTVRPS